MQRAPPRRLTLSQLTIGPVRDEICVRAMRRWIHDGNEPGGAIRYIGLVLTDEKGESIYAQILHPQVHKLGHLIEAGSTYVISKFNVRTSKTGYIPFEKENMIEFTGFTTIVLVKNPPETFPAYVYNLTPFSQINPLGTTASKLIDILGVLTAVESPKVIPLTKKERLAMIREITIKNMSDEEPKVTLWENRAMEFSVPTSSASVNPQSIVVLFVGYVATTLNHVVQVYGGNACQWYFSPDIKEAQPFYNRLKALPVPVYIASPDPANVQQQIKPIIIEHKTLDELNAIDPYDFPPQGCKCTVTITAVHEAPRWWYTGCANCGKAPDVDVVPFECVRCHCKQSKPLYKLSFSAADDTAEAKFFGYDEVSRRIIRRNIEFMLRQATNGPGLPQHMMSLITQKYIFVVGLTTSSFSEMDSRTYLVKRIAFDFHEQAYIANQLALNDSLSQTAPSSSSSPAGKNLLQLTDHPSQLQPSTEMISATHTVTPPPPAAADDTPEKHPADSIQVDNLLVRRNLFPSIVSTTQTADLATSSLLPSSQDQQQSVSALQEGAMTEMKSAAAEEIADRDQEQGSQRLSATKLQEKAKRSQSDRLGADLVDGSATMPPAKKRK